MANRILNVLSELGIIDPNGLESYARRVRDREDVQVLRCPRSGVILLSSTDHIHDHLYRDKIVSREVTKEALNDVERRVNTLKCLITGRRWLDVGTGAGFMLDALESSAALAVGVEPNTMSRDTANARGRNVVASLQDLGKQRFDVVTLFHVFEHLTDPVGMAQTLRQLLDREGVLILEVPHARDFLLETLDCHAFRDFTLWSEHLILHTSHSLKSMIHAAGFPIVDIVGLQRYPLSNHLYWLRHGQPGGHSLWQEFNDAEIDRAYAARLQALNQTDTLLATARLY